MEYGFNFITDRIALGGQFETPDDMTMLKRAGITAVINCREVPDPPWVIKSFAVYAEPQPAQPDDGKPRTLGWFQSGIGVWLPLAMKLDERAYVHCFPPDTMVGQEVPCPIAEADRVIGHDGDLHDVTDQMERHYSGPLVRLKADGCLPIRSTPEHPYLVVRPYRYPGGFAVKPSFARTKPNVEHLRTWFGKEPTWVAAQEIQLGDFLITPRVKLSDEQEPLKIVAVSDHHALLPVSIPDWSEDLLWLFGLFIADGHTDHKQRYIGLTLGKRKDSDRAMRAFESFGLTPAIRDYGEYRRIIVSSSTLATHFRDWFGEDSPRKHIPAFLMRSWAVEALLAGILHGDGTRGGRGNVLDTTSLVLAHQVRQLLLFQGKHPYISLTRRNGSEFPNAAPLFRVYWRDNIEQSRACWFGDLYCQQVREIGLEDYDGPIHNLSVAASESYLANGVAVHNCHAGINRSASMVYALLLYMGLTPDDARWLIVRHRWVDAVGIRYADEAELAVKAMEKKP